MPKCAHIPTKMGTSRMQSQTKRAFRFHPAFRECVDCLRLWRKEAYGWHREGFQYSRCPDCYRIKWRTYDKRPGPQTKFRWSPDDKTIITLAHARGWHPLRVAISRKRTLMAVKSYSDSIGLGPWPVFDGEHGIAATYAQRRMAHGKSLLDATRARARRARPADNKL